MKPSRRPLGLLCATVFVLSTPLSAQTRPAEEWRATLAVGASTFDLSGTGTAPAVAGRISRAIAGPLTAEGALTLLWPDQQFGQRTTFVAPEVQLQWEPLSGRRIAPYLGVGAGFSVDVRDGRDDRWEETLSGALGVRLPVGAGTGLVVEGRIRGVDAAFVGTLFDLTMGVYRTF